MSIRVTTAVWAHAPKTLSATARLVLLALADSANDNAVCWPSVPGLADRVGTSERAVQRALGELDRTGQIQREPRPGRNTLYRVTPDASVTPADMAPVTPVSPSGEAGITPPLTPASPGGEASVTRTVTQPSIQPSENRQTSREVATLDIPAAADTGRNAYDIGLPRFVDFWDAYPRKVGKAAARKAYRTAINRAGPDAVVDGAVRLSADPNLPEQQYIPHPATWLNRDGWDDEPMPNRGRPSPQISTGGSRALSTLELARRYAEQEAQEGAPRAAIADRPAAG